MNISTKITDMYGQNNISTDITDIYGQNNVSTDIQTNTFINSKQLRTFLMTNHRGFA
jgi:hypothetical protein